MKKPRHLWAYIAVALFWLFAFAATRSDDAPQSTSQAVADTPTPQATATARPEIVIVAPEPTATPEPEPTQDGGERAYLEAVAEVAGEYDYLLSQIPVLQAAIIASDDPAEGQALLTDMLNRLRASNERVRNLQPPAQYTEHHGALTEAANQYDMAADALERFTQSQDATHIVAATDAIRAGNQVSQRLNELLP